MKKIYRAFNNYIFRIFFNQIQTSNFEVVKEEREAVKYFKLTKKDHENLVKYRNELFANKSFDEILNYNPLKFQRILTGSEIKDFKSEISDQSATSLSRRYDEREVYDRDMNLNYKKLQVLDDQYQEIIGQSIEECYIKNNTDENTNFKKNYELEKYFAHCHSVYVCDVTKQISVNFRYQQISSDFDYCYLKSDSFYQNEKYFVDDAEVVEKVMKREKEIRLMYNGPESRDNESLAKWYCSGINGTEIDEYSKLFKLINYGGIFYFRNELPKLRSSMDYDLYQDYHINSKVSIYNPILDAIKAFKKETPYNIKVNTNIEELDIVQEYELSEKAFKLKK